MSSVARPRSPEDEEAPRRAVRPSCCAGSSMRSVITCSARSKDCPRSSCDVRAAIGLELPGLLKHLALSDGHYWFRCVIGVESFAFFPEGADADWAVTPDESVENILALYRDEIDRPPDPRQRISRWATGPRSPRQGAWAASDAAHDRRGRDRPRRLTSAHPPRDERASGVRVSAPCAARWLRPCACGPRRDRRRDAWPGATRTSARGACPARHRRPRGPGSRGRSRDTPSRGRRT